MSTYLLTWNPKRWQWEDLQDCIQNIRRIGYHDDSWSSGNTKKIKQGDRVFILRQGISPKGIFASGWAMSNVYPDAHWDETAPEGQSALFVDIRLEVLLDPDHEPIFPRESLNHKNLERMHWDSQSSGISIPTDVAINLEAAWSQFLASRGVEQQGIALDVPLLPEEVVSARTYYEGAIKLITVNVYERNAEARRRCLEFYGHDCYVCGFNFEAVYGEVGATYIHVHHLKPLADIGKEYEVDPIQDLRPICPNCHAIIHRRRPAYTIEEVKQFLSMKVRKSY